MYDNNARLDFSPAWNNSSTNILVPASRMLSFSINVYTCQKKMTIFSTIGLLILRGS